jgi:predicted nucleic acid-binding protein
MTPMFSRPVICNTGPIIGLARIDMAWLPFRLFPKVIVPDEVRRELLVRDNGDRAQIEQVLKLAQIHDCGIAPDPLLQAELDVGEASVIATALQLGVSAAIIDERKARRIASRVYRLEVKGSAGLLVEAKRRGLIPSVGACLKGMVDAGYFLGPRLVAACLTAAGED